MRSESAKMRKCEAKMRSESAKMRKCEMALIGHHTMEMHSGILIKRLDMRTTQEEADTIIVQQVADVQADRVLVVADDTDIFVLLLHLLLLQR